MQADKTTVTIQAEKIISVVSATAGWFVATLREADDNYLVYDPIIAWEIARPSGGKFARTVIPERTSESSAVKRPDGLFEDHNGDTYETEEGLIEALKQEFASII